MRVALVSMKHVEGDIEFNLDRHRTWIERCLEDSPDFIGFPEFAVTGWVTDTDLAVSLRSAVVREIEGWGKRYGVFIATCLVETRAGKLFNTCLITGPNGRVGVMRKVNLIRVESEHYTPGAEFPVLDVAGCKMGVTTCADATRFEMMNILSLRGAEVIFAPHANTLGSYGNSADGWFTWRMERWPLFARDACVSIAGINNAGLFERTGKQEQATKYCGGGMVVDWTGNVVRRIRGDMKRERMIVADVDLDALRKARATHNLLAEIRPGIVYNRQAGWVMGRTD